MTHHRTCLAFALLLSLPGAAHAQTLRGSIADERDAPVAGVVMQLLDAESAIIARALSSERGEYRLTAPSDGTYRVRTQRIGFRPRFYGPFTLRAGEDMTQRLVLTGLPVVLSTVSVIGQNPCRSPGDSTSATYLVWEQVRTALSAAQLTASMGEIASTRLMYERLIDPASDSLLDQTASFGAASVAEPWRSATADSLRERGYVVAAPDGSTIYRAPDLEVLLSDMFLEDHCFRLAPSSDAERIGIAFEPTLARRRIPEIEGTLWVDRRSSELRTMEFRYTNIVREHARYAGGTSDFVALANGAWLISQWEIRMPLLERRPTGRRIGRGGPRTLELHTAAVKIDGGRLLVVRQGDDTLWARPPIVLAGSVSDRASHPVSGARISLAGTRRAAVSDAAGRFTIADVFPATYTVEVRTASLDSIGLVHESRVSFTDARVPFSIVVPSVAQMAARICTNNAAMRAPGVARGIISGRVSATGAPSSIRNAQVVAEWVEGPAGADTSAEGAKRSPWIETRSDVRGVFHVCGVPIGVEILLMAAGGGRTSRPLSAIIPPGQSHAYVSLALDSSLGHGANPGDDVLAATESDTLTATKLATIREKNDALARHSARNRSLECARRASRIPGCRADAREILSGGTRAGALLDDDPALAERACHDRYGGRDQLLERADSRPRPRGALQADPILLLALVAA